TGRRDGTGAIGEADDRRFAYSGVQLLGGVARPDLVSERADRAEVHHTQNSNAVVDLQNSADRPRTFSPARCNRNPRCLRPRSTDCADQVSKVEVTLSSQPAPYNDRYSLC